MTYEELWQSDEAVAQLRAAIAGTDYGPAQVVSALISAPTYKPNSPTVGGTCARQLDLVLRGADSAAIPRMAQINLDFRLAILDAINETELEASDWKPKGTWFFDTRKADADDDTLTIHAYDAMLKMEQYLLYVFADQWAAAGEIDLSAPAVMAGIAARIGVTLDERTVLDPAVRVPVPEDIDLSDGIDDEEAKALSAFFSLSMRTAAGYIAALHGGNWTITDAGKLYLVPLAPVGETVYTVLGDESGALLDFGGGVLLSVYELPEAAEGAGDAATHTLEQDVASLSVSAAFAPWTGVRFTWDREELAFAGDETGRVLECECPWATETDANRVLGRIAGHVYRPYTATGALLDPAAELGDLVSVDGLVSVLASIVTDFGGLCVSEISAPADQEIEHEYPYDPPVPVNIQRSIDRSAAATKAGVLASLGSVSRTTELDFSHIVNGTGYFVERVEGDETYYRFDVRSVSGGVAIVCPDGKTITVTL